MEELIIALAGMLAIEESVTQGQERACRSYWVRAAHDALRNAGRDRWELIRAATKQAEDAARPA